MGSRGTVRDTYVAALQNDLVELAGDEHLAGVVRRPTPWFYAEIDYNYRALGPPESLLEECKRVEANFEDRGYAETAALNAAWEEVDFARRYRDYLDSDEAPNPALNDLSNRLGDGETVVLVCYEGDDKRCHRRILREQLGGASTARSQESGPSSPGE